MGSEESWNEINDCTSFKPSETALCANGCGFFGTAATMNLCSKCYRDLLIKEEQAASAKAAMKKSLNPITSPNSVQPHHIKEEQAASATAAMKKSLNPIPSPNSVQPHQTVSSFPVESFVGPSSSSSTSSSESPVVSTGSGDEWERGVGNRCWSCKRKVGLTGFKCRCGSAFCGTHRYPEKHDCTFDFKAAGRDAISKANPVVKADKVERF